MPATHSATKLYACTLATDLLTDVRDEADVEKRLGRLNTARLNIDMAIGEEIGAWRAEGASWSDVGRALGVSKQAAQQRFGR